MKPVGYYCEVINTKIRLLCDGYIIIPAFLVHTENSKLTMLCGIPTGASQMFNRTRTNAEKKRVRTALGRLFFYAFDRNSYNALAYAHEMHGC